MPRQAHGRPLNKPSSARSAKRSRPVGRGLNALEIAESENVDEHKLPRHRLGEIEGEEFDKPGRSDLDERSSKRRKVDVGQTEEVEEGGSDLEGNSWHYGLDEEDEDSDIDSDEAFGESDEERFANFKFGGSGRHAAEKRTNVKGNVKLAKNEIDLSEGSPGLDDSDELGSDDDDMGEDAVDLATAWDMTEEEDGAKSIQNPMNKTRQTSTGNSDQRVSNPNEQFEAGSAEDEEESISELSVSDGEDGGDYKRLQSFIEELEPSSKQPIHQNEGARFKSLPDKPSQFGIASKISAADLLQYVKDPQQRKSLKILQNNPRKGNEAHLGGIPGRLAPPLAKRQQDRLDREAAYGEAKTQLNRWVETVKKNRRAEHISFPLIEPGENILSRGKHLATVPSSGPFNDLESKIQQIMQESGMISKDGGSNELQEQEFEDLEEKETTLEELQARRAELRRDRDLLFREEIRAKRIKKIKSKAYRRIHRKERDKSQIEIRAQLAAQGLLNSDEERERNDRQRAETRMGARHKESRWAKNMKATGRTAWDDDARVGVADLNRRDEQLRRRIEGKKGDDSNESGREASSESENESDSEQELQGLKYQIADAEATEEALPQSRLASMPFMRKAEAARKSTNQEELRQIRRSLRDVQHDGIDSSDEDQDAENGRQQFGARRQRTGPVQMVAHNKSEFEERMSDDEGNLGDPEHENPSPSTAEDVGTGNAKRKHNNILEAQAKALSDRSAQVKQSADSSTKSSTGKSEPKTSSALRNESVLGDYGSSSESDQADVIDRDSNVKDQLTLADTIFAGPEDAFTDFTKEKKQAVEEEGDQVTDNTLPGWGSWTGEGVSKREQKRSKGRFFTTVKGIQADQRQDAKLDRVIINEKRVKKNAKYLATELPHPFELRHQYERSLRLPLGPEWTTKSTFQDATKPRVLLKQGIIRPMTRPLA